MASVSFMRDCEPISILSLRGNMKARAECAVCGVHHDWEVANRVPPERVRMDGRFRAFVPNVPNVPLDIRRSLC